MRMMSAAPAHPGQRLSWTKQISVHPVGSAIFTRGLSPIVYMQSDMGCCGVQSYPELEVSLTVQAAAVVGVGLLYQGSCTRCLSTSPCQDATPAWSVGATYGSS